MNQIIWLPESIHTHKYTSFTHILITFLLYTNSFVAASNGNPYTLYLGNPIYFKKDTTEVT